MGVFVLDWLNNIKVKNHWKNVKIIFKVKKSVIFTYQKLYKYL